MTDTLARALWTVAAGRAEIGTEVLPPAPGPGQVRVRALHSGLSRGTESLVFRGLVPPAEYTRMRGPRMGGAFPFPVKYGYAMVGRVEIGPVDLLGRAVFVLHPHQDLFDVDVGEATVLPDALPMARAVLCANMETALNGLWDAGAGPADRIAIVGAGVVGGLVARLARGLPGADVTLVDIDPGKKRLADALGVGFATPEEAPGGCDLVVHASATGPGLSTAIGLAGDEATVLELSWFGEGTVPVALGGRFHAGRVKLVSSQVGQVATSRRARWDYARRKAAALRLLDDPALDALLEPAVRFLDLPARLPEILGPGGKALCQVVDY